MNVRTLLVIGNAMLLWSLNTAAASTGQQPDAAQASMVQAAEDREALRTLTHSYGYFLEKGQWDDLIDLFTDTATIEYTGGGYAGKQGLRQYFFHRFGGGKPGLPDGRLANHIIMQGVTSLSSDGLTAKGRWRSLIQNAADGQPFHWLEGVYEFGYAKVDGLWRIQKIHYFARVFGTYRTGWMDDAALRRPAGSGEMAVDKFPPTFPATTATRPYPDAYVPTYHYGANDRATILPPALPASRAELARRVARLEDRDQIEALQNRFGYYFDKKRWDKIVPLFSDDARYEFAMRGVFKGKAGVRRALALEGGPGLRQGDLFTHMQMMPVISVAPDGQTARGRWRVLAQLATAGEDAMWGEGVYENDYVKRRGVWRISRLRYYPAAYARLDAEDWRATSEPPGGFGPAAGADAPAQARIPVFPAYFVAPFHYAHPVTGKPIVIPKAAE
ncbi:nuclear transport factor 2 family protein [Polymorphobacter sp.]|uniref:nuclear transport factor 2 family protein n=1 Tax=Polymorphobacter sp. TaxID=1909290 RepID=UPI003F71ADCF